jgi:glycosyltransferase involved in cell wall biosynthesis
LEAQAAARADHVFAITGAVRDVLVGEGVPPECITLLPNAVDTDKFTPRERDRELSFRLGLADKVVVGFIGSFAPYEGLDYLLDATARLRSKLGDVFRVLLVGDGATGRALRARARVLGIDDVVTFTGRVAHADVLDYYSLIDIAVYPRKGVRVCEVVSPLKPLEAMAMAKAVVVSDVKAQTEMVMHEATGLVHRKDDVTSLEAELSRLIESRELRARLGEAARDWVRANRSWATAVDTVESVYGELLGRR